MRRSFIIHSAVLGAALGAFLGLPAHAQPANSVTSYPPALNSQQGAPPGPVNSVPSGAATGSTIAPGAAIGGSAVPSATPVASPQVNTLHPLRQPRRAVTRRPVRARTVRPAASSS